MPDDEAQRSLAERLLAGEKRALARGISLVEDDDPAMPDELAPLIRTLVGLIDKYGSP